MLGAALLLLSIHIFNISFNRITTKAVVYAVEDEYQIVFSSATESRAWVTIDDKRYLEKHHILIPDFFSI